MNDFKKYLTKQNIIIAIGVLIVLSATVGMMTGP